MMIERIIPWVKGKKVLILGFGREGKSTWNVLKKLDCCALVDVADMAHPKEKPEGIGKWTAGEDYQKCLNDYDVVFKSPGVVLEKPVKEYTSQILSQTELFFQCFRDQIIGITGTKGKSTITTLIYHLLKEAGMDTILVGNIGIPVFDHMEEVGPDTRIVCELSCHQLEYMTVSPHIAILTNLHEEHLDHYGTLEKYVQAKRHIYSNQKEGDVLVCNVQCLPKKGTCTSKLIAAKPSFEETLFEIPGVSGQEAVLPEQIDIWKKMEIIQENDGTKASYDGHFIKIPTDQIRLLGQHNYFDIGIAYAVCSLLKIEDTVFINGLKSYQPLPHRLQPLGEKDGIKYYDDSISTICETTIQALNTLKDVDTVLIGGMDRGIDYSELINFLSGHKVPHIILMEATGKRILEEILNGYPDFQDKDRLVLTDHLEDAVAKAQQFLEKYGYSSMKDTYYETRDGVMTLNFAYYEPNTQTICYTDLIKVEVSLQDGSIVGLDARGYLVNHHDRTLQSPSITVEQAQQSLSDILTVDNTRLALIPTSGQNEVCVYEFLCTSPTGDRILSYINTQTGAEEQILILMQTPNGTLTK